MGVYELADRDGVVQYIGYAGGKSLFGLRGELLARLGQTSATRYRIEVTTAYLTRFQELMMVHRADYGDFPPENDPARIDAEGLSRGRLSPS